MIIWINGAFGAGKTQTSYELLRRLGRGWVADPEFIGIGMHRVIPPDRRQDFQDLASWRRGVIETLDAADGGQLQPVIVPMTVVRSDYFAEIIDGLRGRRHRVEHVALQASPETIRRRLRSRGGAVRDLWAEQQIDRCVTALAQPEFARHVRTDDAGIDAVVEDISAGLDLELVRPRLGPVAGLARNKYIQIKHIRQIFG
ncbi:MAG TPA: AAA family ATPase [Microlunatus sp.]